MALSFGAIKSVFIVTNEKTSFSTSSPGHWPSRRGAETINRLQNLIGLRSQNDFDLHIEEIEKRRFIITPPVSRSRDAGRKDFSLADLDTKKMRQLKN